MPSRLKLQSNLTEAEQRKRRQEKYRKRTRSLFNKVRLLAKDTDAWVALVVRDRGGKTHSFRSSVDPHWPPSILELIQDQPSGPHEYFGKHEIDVGDQIVKITSDGASKKEMVFVEPDVESQDRAAELCGSPALPSDEVERRLSRNAVQVGTSHWPADDISEDMNRATFAGVCASETTSHERDLAVEAENRHLSSRTDGIPNSNMIEGQPQYQMTSACASPTVVMSLSETVAKEPEVSEVVATTSHSQVRDLLRNDDSVCTNIDMGTASQNAGRVSPEPFVPSQLIDAAGLVYPEAQQDLEAKPPITARRLLASWNWIFQK